MNKRQTDRQTWLKCNHLLSWVDEAIIWWEMHNQQVVNSSQLPHTSAMIEIRLLTIYRLSFHCDSASKASKSQSLIKSCAASASSRWELVSCSWAERADHIEWSVRLQVCNSEMEETKTKGPCEGYCINSAKWHVLRKERKDSTIQTSIQSCLIMHCQHSGRQSLYTINKRESAYTPHTHPVTLNVNRGTEWVHSPLRQEIQSIFSHHMLSVGHKYHSNFYLLLPSEICFPCFLISTFFFLFSFLSLSSCHFYIIYPIHALNQSFLKKYGLYRMKKCKQQ